MSTAVILGVSAWLVSAWLGAYIATTKGRKASEGLWLGIGLGLLGVAIELALPKIRPKSRVIRTSSRYAWDAAEEDAGRYLGVPDPVLEPKRDPGETWEIDETSRMIRPLD